MSVRATLVDMEIALMSSIHTFVTATKGFLEYNVRVSILRYMYFGLLLKRYRPFYEKFTTQVDTIQTRKIMRKM